MSKKFYVNYKIAQYFVLFFFVHISLFGKIFYKKYAFSRIYKNILKIIPNIFCFEVKKATKFGGFTLALLNKSCVLKDTTDNLLHGMKTSQETYIHDSKYKISSHECMSSEVDIYYLPHTQAVHDYNSGDLDQQYNP